jgi:hypothetical protein
MCDSRSNPRLSVSWRGAVLLAPGKIIPAKIVNFSLGGIQLQCANLLRDGETYQMMIEVPDKKDASKRTQVVCKGKIMYALLSGNEYRAGIKYSGVAAEHHALLESWGGKAEAPNMATNPSAPEVAVLGAAADAPPQSQETCAPPETEQTAPSEVN